MKHETKIAIIGGDARQIFCAKKLAALGFETAIYGFNKYIGDVGNSTRCKDLESALAEADVVILPLPCCTDDFSVNAPLSSSVIPIENVLQSITSKTKVFGGKICQTLKTLANALNIPLYDYYDREEFQISNAVPTAESALAIAINEMPTTICGCKALVMGYGRIGKVLCAMLKSLGADVYASARKYEDFSWISANGYTPIKTDDIADVISDCSLVFNTIPKKILKDELLSLISKDTLIIDLASKPGGVDFEPAKKAGLNVIWALSLPGKTAPVTAGEILCDTVINILQEEGNK